jgi:probable F420-dependent oxidoreductase
MKVDAGLVGVGLDDVAPRARARELEDAGYDGAYTFEGPHDPFFPLLLAAEHTERIELSTAIAIAFARNPMTLANIGYDLQLASKGRFALGLGSQIKPHIEKRFSMPWSAPAARMRELALAIKAIWTCWQDGTPLRFEGDFYRHTLMTPFFNPGPNPHGPARIWLAGVGPTMTEVAGEVADGFIVHPFNTERFLREVTLPALERGFAKSGRSREGFEISFPLLTITGDTEEELAAADAAVRAQMGFYGSTPAYARVLELHGWGDIHPELNRMTKSGGWGELGSLITDEMVDAFAVRGRAEELPGLIRARYGDLVDRISFNAPAQRDPARWSAVLDGFRATGT